MHEILHDAGIDMPCVFLNFGVISWMDYSDGSYLILYHSDSIELDHLSHDVVEYDITKQAASCTMTFEIGDVPCKLSYNWL